MLLFFKLKLKLEKQKVLFVNNTIEKEVEETWCLCLPLTYT
jgi:hypothetical protein